MTRKRGNTVSLTKEGCPMVLLAFMVTSAMWGLGIHTAITAMLS